MPETLTKLAKSLPAVGESSGSGIDWEFDRCSKELTEELSIGRVFQSTLAQYEHWLQNKPGLIAVGPGDY